MNSKSDPIERVKDGMGAVVEKAREVVNDGLDAAKERFEDRADQLDRRYRKTLASVRERAERLSDDVHERVDGAKATLEEGYTQAKKKARRLERDTRGYVRDNPGTSLLIATGVGFLLGLALGRVGRR